MIVAVPAADALPATFIVELSIVIVDETSMSVTTTTTVT